MARAKRIKDNSDFSILIRYKGRLAKMAGLALDIISALYPDAKIKTIPAEEGQEYNFFLIIIA